MSESSYSPLEVAHHLQIKPETLRSFHERFAHFLADGATAGEPHYSSADIGVLFTIQKLLEQGCDDEEVRALLTPKRMPPPEATALALTNETGTALAGGNGNLPQAIADLLSTIANNQQTMLSTQSTVREVVNVIVQDNFNLKEENRKLRDRMLELERALAEYQRREETRKERLEGRVRALENTITALQQQTAQLVQAYRQQRQRRRGWFT
ncbi:MAG: MerR family transcriptional regulator [Caldilineaceae bacterium]